MKKFKLKTLVLALLLAALGTVSAGTLAYFTADTTAHNIITSGNVDIALVETMLDDKGEEVPFEDVAGVMPGQAVSKIVRVENTGVGDAWVRVKLDTSVTVDDKPIEGWQNHIKYQINDRPTEEGDTAYWVAGAEGWYYYNEIVPVNGRTEPIIREVVFEALMGNDYQNSRTEINVSAQAVQAANNPIPAGKAVTDIPGWPEA